MRLDEKTRILIKNEVASQLGAEAVVRLFGSRVDESQKGGDIDLFISLAHSIDQRVKAECRLAASLYIRLGGRHVDVVIKNPTQPLLPIHKQALQQGIIL